MTEQRLAGAQKSLTKLLAGSLYDDAGGSNKRLTGLRACCNETAATAYGNIAEDDLVAADGTKPWEGKRDTTTEGIGLDVLRALASGAHVRDGQGGNADLLVTTLDLYNAFLSIIQLAQRFTKEGGQTAKVGFTGIEFEGKDLFPDDFCPSGYCGALNTNHIGFAVHQKGYFMRTPWRMIPDSPDDETLKIYVDLNMVVNNRKAHKLHSNLS